MQILPGRIVAIDVGGEGANAHADLLIRDQDLVGGLDGHGRDDMLSAAARRWRPRFGARHPREA